MRSAIAFAMLLAGCQLVFPLDEHPIETGSVHGTLTTKTVVADGTTFDVVTGMGDDATLVATVDGEDVAVPVVGGEFTFERIKKDYRLAVSFGGEILEIQDDAAELSLLFSFAGRDGAPSVTLATQITLPDPVGGLIDVMVSTGQWAARVRTEATVDWKEAVPTGNKPVGLLSGAAGDRLYFLRFTENAFGNGARVITDHFVVDDVAMTNGGGLALKTQALTHETVENRCVGIVAHQESNVNRLAEVLTDVPGAPGFTGMVHDWQMIAVPSLETGGTGGAGLAVAFPGSLDLDSEPGKFFDPFDGDVLAFVEATNGRQIKFSDASTATALPAALGFLDIAPTGNDCAANTVMFNDTIALARQIELDNTPLTTEHQAIALERPGNAVLTWMPDNPRFDVFDVVVFEVIAVGNDTGTVIRRHFRTRSPTLVIPDDLLAPGHLYILQITSQIAFPNIAEGDYAMFEFPVITGTVYSSVFEAM